MIVPTKPIGQESLFQQVQVVNGDAKGISTAEKKLLTDMNDLMALAPQNAGAKTSIQFGAPKNIDGTELVTYSTKLDVDKNNPQAAQVEQMLSMFYGPNGMSGSFGAVDDKTFVASQGADDELVKELIASAKSQKDVLSETALVKGVSSQLPAKSIAIYYISLDNILGTAARYAQGFIPIKITVPQDLPPIGIAAGTEGSAIRIDGFIPTQTVQSLIAAGLQAYSDANKSGKGGGL
jgi:hypothetical protein